MGKAFLTLIVVACKLFAVCSECADDTCVIDADKSSLIQTKTKVSPSIESVAVPPPKNLSPPDGDAIDNALAVSGEGTPHNLKEKIKELNDAAAKQTPKDALHNHDLITQSSFAKLTGHNAEDAGCSGDKLCFQGDMEAANEGQLLLFQQLAAGRKDDTAATPKVAAAGKHWEGNKVKYCLAEGIDAEIKHLWDLSVEQVTKSVPGITFEDVGNSAKHKSSDADGVKVCDSAPAIFVQSKVGEGCWSFVGELAPPIYMSGGKVLKTQLLNLQPVGCALLGIAIHELGHALGMAHEQARPDRDNYVTIKWDNIQPSAKHNFDMNSKGYTGIGYDYESLMHYGNKDFSTNGQPTITSKDGAHDTTIGQRIGLSQSDADQLASMYGLAAGKIDGQTGCKNKNSMCDSLTECSTQQHMDECCGCGGGTTNRCWTGSTCNVATPLPIADHKACVLDQTHLFGGHYACVTTNACAYTVRIQCDKHPGYHWDYSSGPGSYQLPPWNEVCHGGCTFKKP